MIERDPLKDLLLIRERMNRFFEDTFGPGEGSAEAALAGTWSPVVDIYETSTEFIVNAEVPEVRQSDIDIRVKDTMITIEGERDVHRSMMEGYHRIERACGRFQRSFLLPGPVDQEGIKATLRDGVLKIILPKKDIVIAKQIEITDT